jgi:hypothetical protein
MKHTQNSKIKNNLPKKMMSIDSIISMVQFIPKKKIYENY